MKERVVVAMSGGVDSSLAAALLVAGGYEVIGMTMRFSSGLRGLEDARTVARILGIKHYALDFSRHLEDEVIGDFCAQYLRGRTPNPCVRCNQRIKFGALLNKALSLNARYLATGHYARIVRSPAPLRGVPPDHNYRYGKSAVHSQKYLLKKGKDPRKDQSYFLYRLNQQQLKHILFPLGDHTKDEVRRLAGKFALPVAKKPGSQEICFLPDNDYRGFLLRRSARRKKKGMNADIKEGPVVNTQGVIVGRHKGIAFYTVGQREGLGIALGHPAYVREIRPAHHTIVVGTYDEACSKECIVKDLHFIVPPSKKKIAAAVKIRYNHKEVPATVTIGAAGARVVFKKAQFAVTPGQSAVFYDKDVVLGGGIIDKAVL